jgi:tRNA dimethylallyltransferase
VRRMPEALVITGPTATGKTAVALAVAERLDAEIVSMDSRQVYRGLDIGTAKPGPAERARVPHHGLDLVEPTERFSAGRFARYARDRIAEIEARGRVPLLVGGTGFFLRALLRPIFAEPAMDDGRREALRRALGRRDTRTLARWLARLDPLRARALAGPGGGGRQRLLRSLELALLTGRPHSAWIAEPPEAEPLHAAIAVLWLPRAELYRRIDTRVDAMMRAGLLDEVRQLLARYPADAPGFKTHGYMELIPVVRGEVPLEEGVEAVKRDTRAYARRQMTWFRHQLPRGAVFLDARAPADRVADAVARYWTTWRARTGAGQGSRA